MGHLNHPLWWRRAFIHNLWIDWLVYFKKKTHRVNQQLKSNTNTGSEVKHRVNTTLLLPSCKKELRGRKGFNTCLYWWGTMKVIGADRTVIWGHCINSTEWNVRMRSSISPSDLAEQERLVAGEFIPPMKYLNSREPHGTVFCFTYILRNNTARVTRQAYYCNRLFSCSNIAYIFLHPSHAHGYGNWLLTIIPEMRHWATVCLTLKSYLSSSKGFNFVFHHLTFIYPGKSNENAFCRYILTYTDFTLLSHSWEIPSTTTLLYI